MSFSSARIMVVYLIGKIITPLFPMRLYTSALANPPFLNPYLYKMFPLLSSWAVLVSQPSLLGRLILYLLSKISNLSSFGTFFLTSLMSCAFFIRQCVCGDLHTHAVLKGSDAQNFPRTLVGINLAAPVASYNTSLPSSPATCLPFSITFHTKPKPGISTLACGWRYQEPSY